MRNSSVTWAMSHKQEPISANWEDREFVQTMQIGVLEIARQLNRFDHQASGLLLLSPFVLLHGSVPQMLLQLCLTASPFIS